GTEAAKAQESEPADGRHRSRYQTHRRDEVQRAPEARRLPRRGRSGVARTGMAGDPRRILLVDDDLESRTALSELFGVWGYEVEVAEDGKRALELARQGRPDVVVMDLGLPDGDALHVIQLLSADGIRVIAFSGWDQAEVVARAAGADAFVVKPN